VPARDALTATVTRYDQAHLPRDAALAALRDRVVTQWTLVDDDNKAPRLVVKRVRAFVELLPEGLAQAYVTVVVCAEIPGPDAWKAPDRMFDYTGPAAALATWIDEGGDFVSVTFDAAYAALAERVIAEMTR